MKITRIRVFTNSQEIVFDFGDKPGQFYFLKSRINRENYKLTLFLIALDSLANNSHYTFSILREKLLPIKENI